MSPARKPRGTSAALDETGEADVFTRVADGDTMAAIAADHGITRQTVYAWIKAGGPERQAAFDAARRVSAEVAVEEAQQILDDAENVDTAAKASIARARSDFRRWLASVRDRSTYGEKGVQVNVGINLGALHLDALRARGSASALASESEAGPIIDAELIEEDDDVIEDNDVIRELLGS